MAPEPIATAVLDAIQRNLPLTERPFATIADEIGSNENEVLRIVRDLEDRDLIREISAILNGANLGFHSSLVAARVPTEEISGVAAAVSANPRVSHNYEREHEYNLWFTIAAPNDTPIDHAVGTMLDGMVDRSDVLLLPAVRTYKLRVHLPSGSMHTARRPSASRPGRVLEQSHGSDRPSDLTEVDRRLLAVLERPLPVVADFWAEAGRRAGVDTGQVTESIARWRTQGVVRRVSAVLRHRKMGYTANGMGCYALTLEEADARGPDVAEYDFVSHCYYRDAEGGWPYPFFSMIHAREKDECMERAQQIAKDTEARDYRVLFSQREFKKERVRYFEGAT